MRDCSLDCWRSARGAALTSRSEQSFEDKPHLREELDDSFLGKGQILQDDLLTLLSFERFILNTGIYVGERFTFMFFFFFFFVSEEAIMKAEKPLSGVFTDPSSLCSFDAGRCTSIVSARKQILEQIWSHRSVK